MNRVSLLVVFVLAVGYTLAGASATAQAQSFTGKWVHQGRKGTSIIEFFPGEKRVLGPTRGVFHHSILLDDGRVIQGDGHYVFRSVGPNRGWLTLHFAHLTAALANATAFPFLLIYAVPFVGVNTACHV